MRLGDLIEPFPLRLVRGDAALDVADLVDDSRHVTPGSLFIARDPTPGATDDGAQYIAAAIENGAAAVLCREDASAGVPPHVALIVTSRDVRIDQALCGRIAERFFDYPSRKLNLVAVTGTSGKTTTSFVLQHLLDRVGMKSGLIGTVVLDDGAQRRPAELTTPGAIEFSRLLSRMAANGCAAAVAEVSSHALHQGRVAALDFACGILTNLTGDHLDYHGTMDAYAAAKAILFENLSDKAFAVVNADDLYADRMVRDTKAHILWTTLQVPASRGVPAPESTRSVEEDSLAAAPQPPESRAEDRPARAALTCRATLIDVDPTGSQARFDGPWGSVEVKLPLVGKHNVQNVLQAIAAANAVAAGLARVLRPALATAPQVPGRLERVLPDQNTKRKQVNESTGTQSLADALGSDQTPAAPTVLVDYAHKTDAIENVLLALRPLVPQGGRLVCVFGCGGDRDKTKRPKMAAVACRLADRVVVTSDNPRTEDPDAIIRDVLEGVPAEKRAGVVVEPDRAAAIRAAVAAADAKDTVLIAGKGHEDYQIIGKTKRHFDDREHAAAALRDWQDHHAGRVGV